MAVPMRRIDAPRRRHRAPDHFAHRGRSRRRWRDRLARDPRQPLSRRDGYSGIAEAAAVIEQRPQLRVVPRRRLAANAAAIVIVVIGVLMLAAVVLHTRLAERQLQIDRLEQQVANANANFDVLRQQRAELRSPGRLELAADPLGMIDSYEATFVEVDPYLLASVLAATGDADVGSALADYDPLDQVRRVRAAGSGSAFEQGSGNP